MTAGAAVAQQQFVSIGPDRRRDLPAGEQGPQGARHPLLG
jgi:hypothetical protein